MFNNCGKCWVVNRNMQHHYRSNLKCTYLEYPSFGLFGTQATFAAAFAGVPENIIISSPAPMHSQSFAANPTAVTIRKEFPETWIWDELLVDSRLICIFFGGWKQVMWQLFSCVFFSAIHFIPCSKQQQVLSTSFSIVLEFSGKKWLMIDRLG